MHRFIQAGFKNRYVNANMKLTLKQNESLKCFCEDTCMADLEFPTFVSCNPGLFIFQCFTTSLIMYI